MVKPISQLGPDLNRRLAKIDKAIADSARDSVRQAAIAAKAAQLDEMRHDAGGDLRLSRVRSGRGATIGARFTLSGAGAATVATVKATGPVPLLANPMPEHDIPKVGPRARRRKRLKFTSGDTRGSAHHPGTKGKDTWNDGRQKAQPRIRTLIARNTDQAVVGAFKSGG